MKLPILGTAFACGVLGGSQVPSRILHKLTPSKNHGVDFAHYSGTEDVVSRFRLFETFDSPNPKGDIANYLSNYGTEPLTKSEMTSNLMLQALKEVDMSKVFQVSRNGKDKDPFFWSFGKVHGLENIAFVDPEELHQTNGNPVKIQRLINKVSDSPLNIDSYETLVELTQKSLIEYKQTVSQMGLNSSDRKKLLALPFYMAKRVEQPQPKKGQWEYEFFEELYGFKWHDDLQLMVDPERKITEFDYENFLHPYVLQREKHKVGTPEWKTFIRTLNFNSKTRYERLQEAKKEFSELMPLLRGLTKQEAETLLHKLQNRTEPDRETFN